MACRAFCKTPRLNVRRFEEKVVGKIRENVLTESNIRALVKLVDEEMDGVAAEQRQKLETIEAELVKEIVVMPDNAVVRYTIPMPEDSPIGGSGRRGDGPERLGSVHRVSWWAGWDSNPGHPD